MTLTPPEIPFDPHIEDRASEDDRIWFEERPGRNYRFRPRLAGELGAMADARNAYIIVTQLFPGCRRRNPVGYVGPTLPPDDDRELERLNDLMDAGEAAIVIDGHVYSLSQMPGGNYA